MVPEAMADDNDETIGHVPVCSACAHLEFFKTMANAYPDMATMHITSDHPNAQIGADASGEELEDYHDALHYGDTDEETAGQLTYPAPHEDKTMAVLARYAARARGVPVSVAGTPRGPSPLAPPGTPLAPRTPYPTELHPDTPYPIDAALDAVNKGLVDGSALSGHVVISSHPYASLPVPVGLVHSRDRKAWNSGRLSHEQVLALDGGVCISDKHDINNLVRACGGLDGSGRPAHGIHPDHFGCEAAGGSKLTGVNVTCHRCGQSVDYSGNLGIYSSDARRPSVYDNNVQKAKTMAINYKIGLQHDWYYERPGRPSDFDVYVKPTLGFNVPGPTSGTYEHTLGGKPV
jgi:hypothetical protein